MGNIRSSATPQVRHEEKTVGPSLTQAHMGPESDINNIVAKYMKTGIMGSGAPTGRQAMFGDFTAVDFMHMKNTVIDAEQKFAALPSRLRNRFNNDPFQLLRFVDNADNRDEAIKLGLIEKPVEKEAVVVPPIIDAIKADEEANPHKKAAPAP